MATSNPHEMRDRRFQRLKDATARLCLAPDEERTLFWLADMADSADRIADLFERAQGRIEWLEGEQRAAEQWATQMRNENAMLIEALHDDEAKALRPCRHCGHPRRSHDAQSRRCAGRETSFWPVGEPGGG